MFTASEANALLPQLRQMVGRLQEIHNDVQEEFVRIERMRLKGYTTQDNVIHLFDEHQAKAGLEQLMTEGNRLIRRIQKMGCQIKDLDTGMIDFPAQLDGRPVFLCWRSDEPWVMYYHEVDAGAAGRRPIPAGMV